MGNCCAKEEEETKDSAAGIVYGSCGRNCAGDNAGMRPSNPLVKVIHEQSEFDSMLKDASGKVTVAEFYAPWCGPCQQMSPKVDKFADEFVDKALFAKINVDENDELASTYGISCMPTFIIFLKGEKVEEISGANLDKLHQLIVTHTEKLTIADSLSK